MEAYKRGSHTVWDCKYHLVWVTNRYPVLGGDVGIRCRELLRETARAHEMVVHAGSINRGLDHCPFPPRFEIEKARSRRKKSNTGGRLAALVKAIP
jgi:putative transposase